MLQTLRQHKLNDLMIVLFLLFCFFPYLRLLPFNMDSQPNALIFSVIVVLLWRRKMNRSIFLLFAMLVAAVICMVFSNPNTVGLIVLTNYISLFFIAYATYISMSVFNGMPYKLFRYVVYTWFLAGIIQLTVSPSFMTFLLYRSHNAQLLEHGRGVTSFAVEPTFYGMICIILMLINHVNFFRREHYKQLMWLLLIQLVLFSRSTTCFFLIAIALVIFTVYRVLTHKNRFRYIAIFLLVMLVSIPAMTYVRQHFDIRFAKFLGILNDNPTEFLLTDTSTRHRFSHSFFPIKGFLSNFGLPHGLGVFNEYLAVLQKDPRYRDILVFDVSKQQQITTAIGGPLFEIGIFSLPLYFMLVSCFRKIRVPYSDLCFFMLMCLMMNAMNFNQAILPMFVGNLLYLRRHPEARGCPQPHSAVRIGGVARNRITPIPAEYK